MRAGRGFTLAELKVRDSFPGSTLFAHLAPPLSFFCPDLCMWAGGGGGGGGGGSEYCGYLLSRVEDVLEAERRCGGEGRREGGRV